MNGGDARPEKDQEKKDEMKKKEATSRPSLAGY